MTKMHHPERLLSSKVILMAICMDFTGEFYHDFGIVYRLGRRLGINPDAIVAAIYSVYPSTATDSIH